MTKDEQQKSGLLIVLSGPSGAGKGTVDEIVRKRLPHAQKSISVTTRKPRPGEKEGVHYYFKTIEEYQQMIADGEFLETAEVYSNYYGTPKNHVLNVLGEGNDILLEIDTLGAKQIRRSYPESVLIFIMPPSFAELKRRLVDRNTESEDSLKRRLSSAKKELAEYRHYDYFVINEDPEAAASRIISIINAEKCSVSRNKQTITTLLGE